MATTRKPGLPTVWITWVTGLLSGQSQCQWAAWLKCRYKFTKKKNDFNIDAWAADHDALVRSRIGEFQVDGAKVRVENENWMRLPGETAILIGKPDLIAELGGQFTIADGKTGDPSKKDAWQMWLYLFMLPKVWKNPNLRVTGEVFYKNGDRVVVHPMEFTAERKAEAFALIRMLGNETEPKRTPSLQDCRFCEIADCPERMTDAADLTPLTTDF